MPPRELPTRDIWLQILDMLDPAVDSLRVNATCRLLRDCALTLWAPRLLMVDPHFEDEAVAAHVRIVTRTLSAALELSNPADVVIVKPGVYAENLITPAHSVWVLGYPTTEAPSRGPNAVTLLAPCHAPAVAAAQGGLCHLERLDIVSAARTAVVVAPGSALSLFGVRFLGSHNPSPRTAIEASGQRSPTRGLQLSPDGCGQVVVMPDGVLHARHCAWDPHPSVRLTPNPEAADDADGSCGWAPSSVRFLASTDDDGKRSAKDAIVQSLAAALAEPPALGGAFEEDAAVEAAATAWHNESISPMKMVAATPPDRELHIEAMASTLADCAFAACCGAHAVTVGDDCRVQMWNVYAVLPPASCHACAAKLAAVPAPPPHDAAWVPAAVDAGDFKLVSPPRQRRRVEISPKSPLLTL